MYFQKHHILYFRKCLPNTQCNLQPSPWTLQPEHGCREDKQGGHRGAVYQTQMPYFLHLHSGSCVRQPVRRLSSFPQPGEGLNPPLQNKGAEKQNCGEDFFLFIFILSFPSSACSSPSSISRNKFLLQLCLTLDPSNLLDSVILGFTVFMCAFMCMHV